MCFDIIATDLSSYRERTVKKKGFPFNPRMFIISVQNKKWTWLIFSLT